MEQKQNDSPGDTIARPPLDSLIEAALDAGRDPRPGRAQRADGWTPERIRTFLEAVARGASVSAAASGTAMSARSAYRLHRRSDAFRIAWDAAQRSARRPPPGPFSLGSIHRIVEPIIRDGKVWGELYRHDNRATLSVLTRLERRKAASSEDKAEIHIVAESFDEFLEIVCSGDAQAAADFIAARREEDRPWPI